MRVFVFKGYSVVYQRYYDFLALIRPISVENVRTVLLNMLKKEIFAS